MPFFEVLGFVVAILVGLGAAGAALVFFVIGLWLDPALKRFALVPALISVVVLYFTFSHYGINVSVTR